MDVADAVASVQLAYPRVWHTMHATHPTDRSEVSPRDVSVLSHLVDRDGVSPGALAEHLGVSGGTLSEALADMERRGLVTRTRVEADRRKVALAATAAGRAAIAGGSGLDADRLGAALARLTPAERATVARGLELLAAACLAVGAP